MATTKPPSASSSAAAKGSAASVTMRSGRAPTKEQRPAPSASLAEWRRKRPGSPRRRAAASIGLITLPPRLLLRGLHEDADVLARRPDREDERQVDEVGPDPVEVELEVEQEDPVAEVD